MNKDIIQAYLWQDIIRLGFSPSDIKEQKSWLHQYAKSLKDFWQTESYPAMPKADVAISGTIDSSSSIGMSFEYSIESVNKFSIRLIHDSKALMWLHDFDGNYFSFPNQVFLTQCDQRVNAIKNMDTSDFESVIDSLLAHPTPHQHIESPIDKHEIRIGGGITNPFLYLFCLRFQLCPFDNVRNAEKDKLIKLFRSAVSSNTTVKISDLMSVPE